MSQERFNVQGPCATVFGAVETGSWRLEHPEVDHEKCVKCGTCQRYCPVDAIMIDRNVEEAVTFRWAYCKGCGICANECPVKCIKMVEGR